MRGMSLRRRLQRVPTARPSAASTTRVTRPIRSGYLGSPMATSALSTGDRDKLLAFLAGSGGEAELRRLASAGDRDAAAQAIAREAGASIAATPQIARAIDAMHETRSAQVDVFRATLLGGNLASSGAPAG